MGHIYIIMIVTAVQIISFKEVIAIANVPSRARRLKFTKALNWYWLATTMYFLYGESVIYYFKHIVLVDKVLLPFATHHRFISFMLYIIGMDCVEAGKKMLMYLGFVFFVASLQAGHYRFQFTQFAWTHIALYLIVVQAHFIMNNVFEGMIWFFLPVSLVICNDIFAYICGITFGRTQLIKLSPKKTVEGFVGAWILTVLFGIGMTNVLMRYKYFICPVNVSYFIRSFGTELMEPGSRRKHVDWTRMRSKPSLHTPHLPPSYLVPDPQSVHHGTYANTYSCVRHIRISDCSLRWLLCFWTQENLQD